MRALGIDLGDRRIGLAISDPSGILARPLRTLARGASDAATVEELAGLIDSLAGEDDSLHVVVVGYPRRLDGSPNDQTPRVERLVASLRERVALPIVLQDERLSSREAEARLAFEHRDWRERKRRLDAAAAAVILQDYLDERRGPLSRPPEA